MTTAITCTSAKLVCVSEMVCKIIVSLKLALSIETFCRYRENTGPQT